MTEADDYYKTWLLPKGYKIWHDHKAIEPGKVIDQLKAELRKLEGGARELEEYLEEIIQQFFDPDIECFRVGAVVTDDFTEAAILIPAEIRRLLNRTTPAP